MVDEHLHLAPPEALIDDEGTADPGLAHERTQLAWTRSFEDVAIVFLALSRHFKLGGYLSILILALMVMGFLTWFSGGAVIRHRMRSRTGQPEHRLFALMTAGALLLAAASMLISFI